VLESLLSVICPRTAQTHLYHLAISLTVERFISKLEMALLLLHDVAHTDFVAAHTGASPLPAELVQFTW